MGSQCLRPPGLRWTAAIHHGFCYLVLTHCGAWCSLKIFACQNWSKKKTFPNAPTVRWVIGDDRCLRNIVGFHPYSRRGLKLLTPFFVRGFCWKTFKITTTISLVRLAQWNKSMWVHPTMIIKVVVPCSTPPKFNGWNLKMMVSKFGISKLPGLLFRWTMLNFTGIWMFPKIVVPPNHPFLIGFSIINHPFWGTPIFGNTLIVFSFWHHFDMLFF